MIGTMKRRPRSLALAGAVLLAVMILGLPAVAQERYLSAWRLNEWSIWESLPEVNPYATAAGFGSGEGWGNSGASIGVTARAVFEPDLSRAEISAEFVPMSRGIITSDPRLFIAPLRQRLEWKVIVTVRNPNDVAMTNARVHNQFGKAFRATLTGQSVGDARMADADVKGLLPSSSGLTWDIGYLGPGDAAKAELTVTTNQAGGRAEFAEEGVYSLDTGFQLTYRLLGKDEVRNTAPCSVIARVNPSALRSDGEPYTVQQRPIERDLSLPERPVPVRPGIGGNVPIGGGHGGIAPSVSVKQSGEPAHITRVDGTGMFKVMATRASDNIGVEDDKFTVPAGEKAEWKVEIEVKNLLARSWNEWTATLTFGPNLGVSEILEIPRSVTVPGYSSVHTGVLTTAPHPSILGATLVTWNWEHDGQPKFKQGSTAYLALKVETDGFASIPEDTTFCDQIKLSCISEGPNPPDVELDPIYIKSAGEPYADVSVTATRLDWRVRKPGTYAALATTMTASGAGKLSIQFSKFADLARTDGVSGTIAAFYGFGDDLAAVETEGWISAAELNNKTRYIDLSEPAPVLMWSKISVGEEDSSAEYENEGVMTFIVSNTQIGEGN